MKINSIKNNHTNTNFNARLNVERAKLKHLTTENYEHLIKKAEPIGTKKDLITFNVDFQGSVRDFISGSVIGFFNRVNASYSLNSLKNKQEESVTYKIYGETEESCDKKTFEFFDKYINSVKIDYEKGQKNNS